MVINGRLARRSLASRSVLFAALPESRGRSRARAGRPRKQAVEHAQERESKLRGHIHEEAERLDLASFAVIKSPGKSPEAYQEALRQAELACRLEPNNPTYLSVLGAAHYRLGKYAEAREKELQAERLRAAQSEKQRPGTSAILAMAAHQLGNRAEAVQYLEQLRDLVEDPSWAQNQDTQVYLKEVEALVDPPPAKPPTIETIKVGKPIDLGTGWADNLDVNVFSVPFTADGHHLLVGGDINNKAEPNLWLVPTDGRITTQRVIPFLGHKGWVNNVAISPDGKYALSASQDSRVFLWDILNSQPLRRKPNSPQSWKHDAPVGCVAFSPDGMQAASGCADKIVRVWELDSEVWKIRFTQHTAGINSMAFSTDGKQVLSADGSQLVLLWDKDTLQVRDRLAGGGQCAAFSPDGKWIISGGQNRLWLWEVATGAKWRLRNGEQKTVGWLSFSPDSRRVLVTDAGGPALFVWDVGARKQICRIPVPAGQSPNRGIFGPDGRSVACGIWRGHLYLWRLSN
jgi:Tol biopolymer transport system component